jgi:histidyl-tRNA synthetase
MKIKAIKGMKDILPPDVEAWQRMESNMRNTLGLYGYSEIRTPLLEFTRLFARTIGEGTDVVAKEMYTFEDQGKDQVTLRPEATASIARAYVEHHLDQKMSLAKLYTIGPMFRTERPQAGRQRQFHQMSAEALGSSSPLLDVEVILMLADLLKQSGLGEFSIRLNSVGCSHPSCRLEFVKQLQAFVKNHLSDLGPECQVRYPERVWRILDCKNEKCRHIMKQGPLLLDQIRQAQCDCQEHFEVVQEGLKSVQLAFEIDPFLVRGLDYYTKSAFEVTAPGLGAQDAVAAGGRYDGLVHLLGGPPVSGVGMAIGLERLLLALQRDLKDSSVQPVQSVYLALLGPRVKNQALQLAHSLRNHSVVTHLSYEMNRSLKSQLREADRIGCRWIIMLGDREIEKGVATLKDLQEHQQEECAISALPARLTQREES